MTSISTLLSDWKRASEQYKNLAKQMPAIAGEMAVNSSRSSFSKGKYYGGGQDWAERREATLSIYDRSKKRGNLKGSVYNKNSPLLVQTGNLRDSIRFKVLQSGKIGRVFVGTDVVYAKIHNEGGTFTMFGKHTATMPKRKYLGVTKPLINRINKRFEKERNIIFNKFKK